MNPRERPTSWPRLVAGNLFVFLGLILVVLGIGEIRYRFFVDTTDSFGLTMTSRRWFERHYAMNNWGYRDNVNYEFSTAPGKRRITILGDSFTAGHGVRNVDDRFANRLRAMRPDWEVHVFARNGWDTGTEEAFVDSVLTAQFAGKYDVDLVVLVYCLNDISDIIPEWRAILDRIYARSRPGFPFEQSYFLNTLFYRFEAAANPDLRKYYDFTRSAYESPLWSAQKERLTHLNAAVEKLGGRLLVVTFPFIHDLGPRYGYAGVHAELDGFWHGLGVPHLDLKPVFDPFEPRRLVVNSHDAHPNEEAHRLAAEAIAGFIEREMKSRG